MAITAVACSGCSQGFGVNPYVSAVPHRLWYIILLLLLNSVFGYFYFISSPGCLIVKYFHSQKYVFFFKLSFFCWLLNTFLIYLFFAVVVALKFWGHYVRCIYFHDHKIFIDFSFCWYIISLMVIGNAFYLAFHLSDIKSTILDFVFIFFFIVLYFNFVLYFHF